MGEQPSHSLGNRHHLRSYQLDRSFQNGFSKVLCRRHAIFAYPPFKGFVEIDEHCGLDLGRHTDKRDDDERLDQNQIVEVPDERMKSGWCTAVL